MTEAEFFLRLADAIANFSEAIAEYTEKRGVAPTMIQIRFARIAVNSVDLEFEGDHENGISNEVTPVMQAVIHLGIDTMRMSALSFESLNLIAQAKEYVLARAQRS
ncbi:MAG: hypothetical protein ABL899_01760 [Nitrospira sp.]